MHKTAYELRISDWSSDVCSSDLPGALDVRRVVPIDRGGALDSRHLRQRGGARWRRVFTVARDVAHARPRLFAPIAAARVGEAGGEVGRASCRERWCQYV